MNPAPVIVTGAWPRRLAVLLLVALLVGAALVAAIVNVTLRSPLPKVPLSSVIGPAAFSELRFAQVLTRGEVTPAMAKRASAAAASDPLAYEPFLYAAASHFPTPEATGRPEDAALLRETLRRNPRSRQARGLLLRQALGSGRLDQAIERVAELAKLGHPGAEVLLVGVGRMVTTPAQIDEAATALQRHPFLYAGLVRGFISVPKPPASMIRLARALPSTALTGSTDDLVIAKLIDLGAFADAREVWARAGGQAQPGLINDPAFANPSSNPPFDWDFSQTPTGAAERKPGGGVYIDYYGRVPGLLLRQVVTLRPGRYRARLDVEPAAKGGGAIAVRVACGIGGDAALTERPLEFERTGRQKVELAFTVPAGGCDGQSLELRGLASERRNSQQIVLNRFDLIGEGAR